MKRTKKLIALITLSMMVGNQSLVLAKIPSGTAIVGDKAYDFEYFNNKANKKEILEELKKNGFDIKVKSFDGKWIDNLTGNELKIRDIPRVWYKNSNGEMTEYFAYDGEEVDFGIDYVYVNQMDEIKIISSSEIGNKNEITKANFKINGKELGEKDRFSISDDNKEITIKLNEAVNNKSYELSVEINNIKGINNKYLTEKYATKVMVVKNAQDMPKGEYDGQLSVLANNSKIDGVTVNGDIYVGGNNTTLNKTTIAGDLIALAQSSGTLSIKSSEYNNVFISEGAKIQNIELENPSAVISEDKDSFKELSIIGDKKKLVLAGIFSKVIINNVKEIKMIPNTEIEVLVVNKDISIEGDSSVKIKEIQKDKKAKVETKKQEDMIVLPAVKEIDKNPPISGGGGGYVPTPDTIKPVITLKGEATVDLYKGAQYKDEGATAKDDKDGDISNKIKTTIKNSKGEVINKIDTNVIDTYTISYDVEDKAGNKADTVNRTIIINELPDKDKPIITLKGEKTISLYIGDGFKDPGVSAVDDKDGDISNKVKSTIKNSKGEIVNKVDTSKVETYTISYDVEDKSGNKADTVTRSVVVSERPDTLPIASEVEITGTLRVDNQLFGSYVYSDEDGDEEGGTIYRWYRADDVHGTNIQLIEGEVYDRYLLTVQDVGKYIFFEVVPVSSNGVQGLATRSEGIGPVVEKEFKKVNVEVEGFNVRVILTGDNLKEDITIRITNDETGTVEYVGQGNPANGRIEFNTRIEKTGNYTLTYNAFQGESNGEYKFTITGEDGEDIIKPVITLKGESTVELYAGETYTDTGASASDDRDGDITSNIVKVIKNSKGETVSEIDTSVSGIFTITYNVSDAAGNKAEEVTRRVIVKERPVEPDTTKPVITLKGESTVNLYVGDNYIDEGAGASDDRDGDITSNIVKVIKNSKGETVSEIDTSVSGIFTITYNVSDAAGNKAEEVTRRVIVKERPVEPDTTKPVITLKGESTVNLYVGDNYIDAGASASDNRDGDISENIKVTIKNGHGETVEVVDTSVPSIYTIIYTVSDVAGNEADAVTRIVTVSPKPDTTKPVITLKGESTVNLYVGDNYIDEGASSSDDRDGDITNKIATIIKNSKGELVATIDTRKVETYTITYNVSDSAGNKADEVTRIVIVKERPDTTKPVITLQGETSITLTKGSTYVEPGFIATDEKDGDITNRVVTTIKNSKDEIVATIDTSKPETYIITYNVSDTAGNAADRVTRTIIVEERLPVASEVEITGTLRVDNQLFGSYVYSDEDGDEEGTSIYRWYRADDVNGTNLQLIEGETYDRYLLASQDIGKYIFFEVVPVSVDATEGVPVRSDVAGPMVSNTAQKINADVDGYNVRVVLNGANLKKDVTVKIINNVTETVEFVGQGQTNNGRIEFNTRLEKIGSFTVEYNAFINESNGTHSLNITGDGEGENDKVKPIISLKGLETIELKVGDIFIDPGYEAVDNKEGDISHKVITKIKDSQGREIEAMDTSKEGQYFIHYSVRDAHGNKAIEKVRKVNVKSKQDDNRITVTTENRVATIVVEGNNMNKVVTMQVINKTTGVQAYVDQKESSDNRVSFTTGSLLPGAYEVLIKAFGDTISSKEFTIDGDVTKPVITLKGNSIIELFVGDIYTEPGFTAIDDKDGEITNRVTTIIKNSKGETVQVVDTSKVETYTITYEVADQEGNKADKVTRTVIVREKKPTATNVTITGEAREGKKLTANYSYFHGNNEVEGNSVYKWYRADDAQGTNLQLIAGATTKEYTLTSADVGKIIFFEVVPVSESGIEGDSVRGKGIGPVVSITQGKVEVEVDGFNIKIALRGENLKRDVTVKIINNQTGGIELTDQGLSTNGLVEFRTRIEKTGTFTLEYNAFQGEPNGRYEFTIVGEGDQDTVKPIIELEGEKSIVIPIGGTYIEPGFRATDNKDGDITNKVEVIIKDENENVVPSINTTAAGIYTIHYNVTDNAGNVAQNQVRTVVVQEGSNQDDQRIDIVIEKGRARITVVGENMNPVVTWKIINVATGANVCVGQGESKNNSYTDISPVLPAGVYRIEMNVFEGKVITKTFIVEEHRIQSYGNEFEIGTMTEFNTGILNGVEVTPNVGDGALIIAKDEQGYKNEGIYISQEIDVPNFEYMVSSWNADTPEGTSVEIQARVLVNHFNDNNEPIQTWSDWLSWGTWSPFINRASADTDSPLAKTSTDELVIKGSAGETASKVQLKVIMRTENPKVTPTLRYLHGTLKNTLEGQAIEKVFKEDIDITNLDKDIATPEYSQMIRCPRIRNSICSATTTTMMMNRFGEILLPEEVAQNSYDNNYGFGNWAFAMAAAGSYGYKAYADYTSIEGLKREIAKGYPVGVSVKYSNVEGDKYPYVEGAPGRTGGHLIVVRGFTTIDGVEYVIVNDSYAPGNDTVRRLYKLEQFEKAWSNRLAYIIHDKEANAGEHHTKRIGAQLRATDIPNEYQVFVGEENIDVQNFGGTIAYTLDNDRTYKYFPKIKDKNSLTFTEEEISSGSLKVYVITDIGKVYLITE